MTSSSGSGGRCRILDASSRTRGSRKPGRRTKSVPRRRSGFDDVVTSFLTARMSQAAGEGSAAASSCPAAKSKSKSKSRQITRGINWTFVNDFFMRCQTNHDDFPKEEPEEGSGGGEPANDVDEDNDDFLSPPDLLVKRLAEFQASDSFQNLAKRDERLDQVDEEEEEDVDEEVDEEDQAPRSDLRKVPRRKGRAIRGTRSIKKKNHLTTFLCNFCSKSFRHKSVKTRHEAVHGGLKPYLCKFCKKCFRFKVEKLRHEQVHA